MSKPILYAQRTCGMCNAIKIKMKQKGIDFDIVEDIDVMKTIGINHTPILEISAEDGSKLLQGKDLIDWINLG